MTILVRVRVRVMIKMTVTVTEMMMMVRVIVRVTVHIMKQQNTVSILRLSACVCAGAVLFSSNKWTKSALKSNSNSKYYVSLPLFYPLISSHLLSFFSPLSSSHPLYYHLCSSSHLITSHFISFPFLLLYFSRQFLISSRLLISSSSSFSQHSTSLWW